MKPADQPQRSRLSWLVVAALVVVAVFALDEYWGLAERIFGGAERDVARHTEFLLEAGVACLVAAACAVAYRRLSAREQELGELLTMCAWCRRVSVNGRWVSVETFLESHDGARTSVSLCPSCLSARTTPGAPPRSV
jgi:hypothetical protein